MESGQQRDGGHCGKELWATGGGWRPRQEGRGAKGAELALRRAEPAPTGRGFGSPSLTCMPGVVARRLQALGAARGWGVAEAGGAPGMVGRFAWQRGAGAGGGRAPGARGGGGGGGRCSLRLGSARLGWARLGSAGD